MRVLGVFVGIRVHCMCVSALTTYRYVRWARDVPCPSDEVPAATLLSDIDYAVHCALSYPRGPVHINMQLRENLAPESGPIRDALPGTPGGAVGSDNRWRPDCIETADMVRWEMSSTAHAVYLPQPAASPPEVPREVVEMLQGARRGLILVGSLHTKADLAAVEWLVCALEWPVWADIQSGLRSPASHAWRTYGVILLVDV